jgi:hypothetical protein
MCTVRLARSIKTRRPRRTLVTAGLAAQARPLAAELRVLVERARGPSAEVFELSAARSDSER